MLHLVGGNYVNLPNWITIFRFALIPVYIYFILEEQLYEAFGVVVLAGLTDILDGYLARSRKQVTIVGKMLDPLADKTLMIVVILSFLYLKLIPWEAALAIFIRDIGMIIGSAIFHFRGLKTVPANMMGKLTTIMYYLAILLVIFKIDFAVTYLWGVIIFSFLTSFVYIFQFKSLNAGSK